MHRLETLPQGKAWKGTQQAGIISASQLRKQVASGRCVPCRGCGDFRVKDAKQQCLVCGIRPPKRLAAARKRFVVVVELGGGAALVHQRGDDTGVHATLSHLLVGATSIRSLQFRAAS